MGTDSTSTAQPTDVTSVQETGALLSTSLPLSTTTFTVTPSESSGVSTSITSAEWETATTRKSSPQPTTPEVKVSTDDHTPVLTSTRVASKMTTEWSTSEITTGSTSAAIGSTAESSGEGSGDVDLEMTSRLPPEISTFVQEVESTTDDLAREDLFTFSTSTVAASTRIITTQAGDL